jgi:hypothetical protein
MAVFKKGRSWYIDYYVKGGTEAGEDRPVKTRG